VAQPLFSSVLIFDSCNTQPQPFEYGGTVHIDSVLLGIAMHATFDFEHQLQFRAKEVHNKTADGVLTPKLKSKHPPIPNQFPHVAFCRRRVLP
jgi:hypothetical protein